jgi:hypothetical protein
LHSKHLGPPRRSIAHAAHLASCAAHCTLPPGGTPSFSLRPFDPTSLLDRHDVVGSSFAETLEIELLDELGQWQFPRLLLVVIDLAQFRRIQPKLSGHLKLAVRQMAALSRIDPFLHLLIRFDFLRHTLSYSLSEADPVCETVERGKLWSSVSAMSYGVYKNKNGENAIEWTGEHDHH